jgi:hypothetical protein
MAKPDKWVNVIDGAGRQVRVRRVDAREIEEGKERRAAEAKGEVVKAEPVAVPVEMPVEIDDQSVAPKASKAKKK